MKTILPRGTLSLVENALLISMAAMAMQLAPANSGERPAGVRSALQLIER
ncbi:MAG: hypothetical protein R3D51_11730 [Hyphomicrobiaceae bacterium]